VLLVAATECRECVALRDSLEHEREQNKFLLTYLFGSNTLEIDDTEQKSIRKMNWRKQAQMQSMLDYRRNKNAGENKVG